MTTYEYILTKNRENLAGPAVCIRGEKVRQFSYGRLFEVTDRLAERLSAAGITPADRVAIAAENSPEWCAAYLAVAKLRATAVLLDISLNPDELKKMVEKSKVRCIMTTPTAVNRLGEIRDIPMPDILSERNLSRCEVCPYETVEGDANVSTILYSSGTTKTASGIMHSHESLIGATNMVIKHFPLHSNHRFMAVLPNSHIYGLICQVLGALMLGASLCYLETLNAESISGAFSGFRPTILPAVPKVFDLLKSQILRKIEADPKARRLFNAFLPKCIALRKLTGINLGRVLFKEIHKGFGDNIEILCSAGAPLSPETAEFFYGTGFGIYITYGATESNIPTIGNYGGIMTTDSCGKAYPDVSVKLGGDGEIIIKSPYMMLGYFGDPEGTRAVFNNEGWFKTGDLGAVDEKTGYFRILGRCKDNIVLSSGKKLAPEDIEAAYAGVPGVKELVVCGIPVTEGGYDEVHAFAVAESPEALDALRQRSGKLAYSMKLGHIHMVDAIPRTTLQKPKRYLLRQMAALPQSAPRPKDIDAIVRTAVAKVAKVSPQEILPETRLFELDIDSLGSIELCCELAESCGSDLSGVLRKDTTLAELTEYIKSPADGGEVSGGYPMNKSALDYNIFRLARRLLHLIYSINIENDRALPKAGGYIICSNHVSNFDYLFLTLNFEWTRFSRFCCMAKKELFSKGPLEKKLAKISGMVPVDRGGFANGAFSSVSGKLRDDWGVLIHPEGTRSANGELSRFKKGAAMLSIEAGVPIIPAYIDGGYEVYPKYKRLPNLFNWKEMKKYRIRVRYGEPVFPGGLNAEELIGVIEAAVIDLKKRKA